MTSRLLLDGAIDARQVSHIRRFTESMLAVVDEDVRARASTATHELIENAIKFSADGTVSLEIEITRNPVAVRIVTGNRAAQDDVKTLRTFAAGLRDARHPMEFYMGMMKSDRRGGLGIGRVAAELDMRVSIAIENDRVTVQADLEGVA